MDWDTAYNNMGAIKGAAEYPAYWLRLAEAYRARTPARLGLAYGPSEREKYDLFLPDGAPQGLAVFVHGGYWMRTGRAFWSHLAEGARARGFAVAIPSYTLAPDARITEIGVQIRRAVTAAMAEVDGPVYLAGHSAGGQLVTRLLTVMDNARIQHVLSISGVHDLAPLMKTGMNEVLQLDAAEVAAESPAKLSPVYRPKMTAWVGADELPEFLRQNRLLAEAWGDVDVVEDAGHHHFSVVSGLTDANSAISRAFVGAG